MRPSNPDAYLFDFDGVIADTEALAWDLDCAAFAKFGIVPTQEELNSICGTDATTSIDAIFKAHGVSGNHQVFNDLREGQSSIYWTMDIAPIDGAYEALKKIKDEGIKIGLVSSTEASDILYALNRIGFTNMFDVIVTGDMVSHKKPSPECYLRCMDLLKVDASNCICVEDSPVGIAAALSSGAYVIGFKAATPHLDTSAANEECFSYTELGV